MKRRLVFLVQACIAACAGYVAWRITAHRLHLFGAPAVWIGLFIFAAALFFLFAFRRGGAPAALASLLPIAGAALLWLLVALVIELVRHYGGLAVDNPALTAAWLIVLSGGLGILQRLVKR